METPDAKPNQPTDLEAELDAMELPRLQGVLKGLKELLGARQRMERIGVSAEMIAFHMGQPGLLETKIAGIERRILEKDGTL